MRVFVSLCVAVAALSAVVIAEPLSRLRGKVLDAKGDPMANVTVRVEARFGFGGTQFTGQRNYDATTNSKGEWTIIGFTAGVWVFDASAPGYLPEAIALPFNLVTPAGQGFAEAVPNWQPILRLAPLPEGEVGRQLAEAAEAARAGRTDRVMPLLMELGVDTDPEVLTTLGRICLLNRDAPAGRAFFHRAQDRDPKSFGAALGMASTALLQKDFDSAAREFGAARDLTSNKAEQAYLTAAIRDLSKLHVTAPGQN
jgi:hypothetical protein